MKRITNWNEINWRRCFEELKAHQNRLAIACNEGYTIECKQLQTQIVRSFAGRALAVKSVVSKRGKRSVGVDNVVWDSSYKKEQAIEKLKNLSNYEAKPVRRVWIPKKGTDEKRALGIATMFDRAVQTLWSYALDPIIERQSDLRSFGFRKSRSVKDAAEYVRLNCGAIYGKRFIGNIDIERFFDTLNHQWILNNIPINKKVLKQFLNAGVMNETGYLENTLIGVPQGGVISPIIANAALNGLETLVEDVDRCQIVRYADDFLILASDINIIESVAFPRVENFLSERGLTINVKKTKIETIESGFDFLGYNFREYYDKTRIKGSKKGIFLVKPTKENILKLIKTCREIIKQNKNASSGHLILKLNPVLRSWAEHYRSVVSSRAFNSINKAVYTALMQWMKRKHRNMPDRKSVV